MFSAVVNHYTRESFDNFKNAQDPAVLLQILLISLAYLAISAVVIKLLWNSVLVGLVSGVRPLSSIWQAVMLKMLFNVLMS